MGVCWVFCVEDEFNVPIALSAFRDKVGFLLFNICIIYSERKAHTLARTDRHWYAHTGRKT